MEEALIAILLATAGISALVTNRIYWTVKPQGDSNPYIVLTKVSAPRTYTYKDVNDLVSSRIQIDCYGLTFGSAKLIARAVEAKLSGLRNVTQGQTRFDGCLLDNERDNFEDGGPPDKLFRTSLDFIIWHKGV
jgi:hypothetical protein